MENISFLVLARPVVDRKRQTKYLKLRVIKKIGNEEQLLQKGAILHFLASNLEQLYNHLRENQRFLFELPLDFLVMRSIIEEIDLSRIAIMAGKPLSKITLKHIIEIKDFIKDYIKNGLELAIQCEIFPKFGLKLGKENFNFVCAEPEQTCHFSSLCFKDINSEEIFQKVKDKGILFYGNLFGEFQVIEEITALSFLQTTIEKVLELLSEEKTTARDLERTIKTDPKLSVEIIKFANSPLIAPLQKIRDLRHAIVYLGFNRLKDFLITFLVNQLATVDKTLYEIALRLSATGFLMEKKAPPEFNKCEVFLAGVIYEFSKITGKSPLEIYNLLSPPKICESVIKNPEFERIYKVIREEEKEEMKEILEKIFK